MAMGRSGSVQDGPGLNKAISNTVKFTDKGSVTITIRVNKTIKYKGVRFIVADTGIGIPAR
jgi:signal transduction histidine kinase